MTEPTTISVRGEAAQVIPPDYATVHTAIHVRDTDKTATLERAGRAQAAAVAALRELGGVPLSVDTIDAALAWSTRTFSARERREYDDRKRPGEVHWQAHVPITVVARGLDRLTEVSRALSAVPELEIFRVEWLVDPRNAAWPTVRAAAIADAVAKARDYAAALGGSVTALVHVADQGLLGGAEHHSGIRQARALSGGGDYDDGGPDLDPAPQEITAVVEARFTATVTAL